MRVIKESFEAGRNTILRIHGILIGFLAASQTSSLTRQEETSQRIEGESDCKKGIKKAVGS